MWRPYAQIVNFFPESAFLQSMTAYVRFIGKKSVYPNLWVVCNYPYVSITFLILKNRNQRIANCVGVVAQAHKGSGKLLTDGAIGG